MGSDISIERPQGQTFGLPAGRSVHPGSIVFKMSTFAERDAVEKAKQLGKIGVCFREVACSADLDSSSREENKSVAFARLLMGM